MRYLATLLFLMFVLTSGAQGEDSVKILSWNVFLRPGILHDHQLERVDSIAKYLSDTDADVLVLQEVFHRKSRKKLIGHLKEKYPFFTSMGPKSFFRIPSSGGICLAGVVGNRSSHLASGVSSSSGISVSPSSD